MKITRFPIPDDSYAWQLRRRAGRAEAKMKENSTKAFAETRYAVYPEQERSIPWSRRFASQAAHYARKAFQLYRAANRLEGLNNS